VLFSVLREHPYIAVCFSNEDSSSQTICLRIPSPSLSFFRSCLSLNGMWRPSDNSILFSGKSLRPKSFSQAFTRQRNENSLLFFVPCPPLQVRLLSSFLLHPSSPQKVSPPFSFPFSLTLNESRNTSSPLGLIRFYSFFLFPFPILP